jgi:hypothetical protein
MAERSTILDYKGALEVIGLSASVVAAVGYASLRAYLDFLGVAGTIEFSFDQLLYEAYALGLPILLSLIAILLLASVLGLFVWAGVRIAAPSMSDRAGRLRVKLRAGFVPLWLLGILIGALSAVGLVLGIGDRTGVLLLPAQEIATVTQRPILFPVSLTLLLVAWGAYGLTHRSDIGLGPVARMAVRVATLVLALSFLWIATIAFNIHVRGLKFPLVSITDRSENSERGSCGFLVYSTSKMWVVWNMRNSKSGPLGVISVRSRSDNNRFMVFGDGDIRLVAKGASPDVPAITCQ